MKITANFFPSAPLTLHAVSVRDVTCSSGLINRMPFVSVASIMPPVLRASWCSFHLAQERQRSESSPRSSGSKEGHSVVPSLRSQLGRSCSSIIDDSWRSRRFRLPSRRQPGRICTSQESSLRVKRRCGAVWRSTIRKRSASLMSVITQTTMPPRICDCFVASIMSSG